MHINANVLEHEGGGVSMPEGYVKAVHFALNEAINVGPKN